MQTEVGEMTKVQNANGNRAKTMKVQNTNGNRTKTMKAQNTNGNREMFDRIILASQSPRRRELLAQLGLSFEVMPAYGEECSGAQDPGARVEELAAAKAREVAGRLEKESDRERLIIGADTLVVKNGEILGKPRDEEDAKRMLALLSGTAHQVCTGLCLILIKGDQRVERHFHETTHVNFAEMTDKEIDDYVASGDPMDKAGAYGIQSGAARFVTGIQGDYSNVVGLPLSRLYREMKQLKKELEGKADREAVCGRESREIKEMEVATNQKAGETADQRERGTAADQKAGETAAVQKDGRAGCIDGEKAKSRLDLQFDFLRELDQEKSIFRQNYIGHHARRENDAEHAWHMAIMAAVLREYANEEVDMERVLLMILLHDVVEIDAGDTYAYDEEGKKSQKKREMDAADRIFHILPPDQEEFFRGLWDEFEAWESPEARFARACDNFQPMMLNRMNGSQSWLDHGVSLSQVLERNARSGEGAREVWNYAYAHFIVPGLTEGKLRDDREELRGQQRINP
ncbi:septum formation protein Maf [Shuttleworthella sp. MSX8B]|nr:Maf family nucleotide pyrophosphatase [Shuttleworthia sp. MSX8B]EUB13528.1 septum formation protein Maf [Shuttleworthia sp. MSX8B]